MCLFTKLTSVGDIVNMWPPLYIAFVFNDLPMNKRNGQDRVIFSSDLNMNIYIYLKKSVQETSFFLFFKVLFFNRAFFFVNILFLNDESAMIPIYSSNATYVILIIETASIWWI